VIKKYIFLFSLLLFFGITAFGQSIKFNDLVYFTSLTNRQVYDNLMEGNIFRQEYTSDVNGQELEYFKNKHSKGIAEKIIAGRYTKLYDGTILRTITYTSTDAQHIINMISQAKRYGLEMRFHGADAINNIYLLGNNFYDVSIYLRRDQTSGLVEIKQREYLGLE
jgi:hypothetical protein